MGRITHVAASPETPDPTTATFMVVLLSDQIAIKEKQTETYWRPAIKHVVPYETIKMMMQMVSDSVSTSAIPYKIDGIHVQKLARIPRMLVSIFFTILLGTGTL